MLKARALIAAAKRLLTPRAINVALNSGALTVAIVGIVYLEYGNLTSSVRLLWLLACVWLGRRIIRDVTAFLGM